MCVLKLFMLRTVLRVVEPPMAWQRTATGLLTLRPAGQAFARGGRTAFYSAALDDATAGVVDTVAPQAGLLQGPSPAQLDLDDGAALPGSVTPLPGSGTPPPSGAAAGLLPTRLALELRRLARRSCGGAVGQSDDEMAGSEEGLAGLGLCGTKTRPPSPGSVSSMSDRSDADVVALGAQLVLEAGLGAPKAYTKPYPNPAEGGGGRRLRGALARSVADVLALYDAVPLPRGDAGALDAHIARLVAAHGLEDPVYVVDLGMVSRLWAAWAAAMPRVAPFYAVKCNDDEALLALLAVLGAGFDCASEAEVDRVLALGVPPGRIVYANACKRPRDIRHAAARGVDLTTFDTPSELAKLAAWHPRTRALLRLRADDPAARCQLGNKYGAERGDVPALLAAAAALGVEVAGVSFHVGSGATNPAAFSEAIALAAEAFAAGAAAGHIGAPTCTSQHAPFPMLACSQSSIIPLSSALA